jgi:hypothetical protein
MPFSNWLDIRPFRPSTFVRPVEDSALGAMSVKPLPAELGTLVLEFIVFSDYSPSERSALVKSDTVLHGASLSLWEKAALSRSTCQLTGIVTLYVLKGTNRFHCETGPALTTETHEFGVRKSWFVLHKRHRVDGPAVDARDQEWWLNDQRHRLDGPAVEWANGYKEWWLYGREYQTELNFLYAVQTMRASSSIRTTVP